MTHETGGDDLEIGIATMVTVECVPADDPKILDGDSMDVDVGDVGDDDDGSHNAVVAVTAADATDATDDGDNRIILPKPKSGRWWKSVRKERSSAIVKVKPLKSSWERKMKSKANLENVKKLQQEVRDKLAAKKAAQIEARKERERRREENARKAEIVQVIKNTQKLKKAKKKLLRKIEKRDIS